MKVDGFVRCQTAPSAEMRVFEWWPTARSQLFLRQRPEAERLSRFLSVLWAFLHPLRLAVSFSRFAAAAVSPVPRPVVSSANPTILSMLPRPRPSSFGPIRGLVQAESAVPGVGRCLCVERSFRHVPMGIGGWPSIQLSPPARSLGFCKLSQSPSPALCPRRFALDDLSLVDVFIVGRLPGVIGLGCVCPGGLTDSRHSLL